MYSTSSCPFRGHLCGGSRCGTLAAPGPPGCLRANASEISWYPWADRPCWRPGRRERLGTERAP
eukprot:scaffold295862_cov41-Tisochrysis_lutea.AAC.2